MFNLNLGKIGARYLCFPLLRLSRWNQHKKRPQKAQKSEGREVWFGGGWFYFCFQWLKNDFGNPEGSIHCSTHIKGVQWNPIIFKYLPIENGLSLISPLYTTCKQEHSAHRKDRTRPSKLPRTRSKQLAHKEMSQAHSHTPLHCSTSRGPNKSLYFKCLSEQKEHTLSLSWVLCHKEKGKPP